MPIMNSVTGDVVYRNDPRRLPGLGIESARTSHRSLTSSSRMGDSKAMRRRHCFIDDVR